MFHLKHLQLPHDGVMPGARGHKKVIVPAGTKVYCIVYDTKIYWCSYLDIDQALKCLRNLTATINGQTRRPIELDTLIAWNFKSSFPKRVCRPPKQQEEPIT